MAKITEKQGHLSPPVRRILRSDYLKLVPIMVLAFYIAFIPHQDFLYPVHLDEWIHMALAKQVIAEAKAMGLTNPFVGQGIHENQIYEVSFHVFWAIFHQITGLPWLAIFRYFPGIIFVFTVLSVFVLGRRQGFGWEAALFTCLIPTRVGILGPGFLVPVAMGLFIIPLALFATFNLRGMRSHLILLIFALFLLSMHPPTAIALVIILIPHILLNLKGDLRHSLGTALALALPFSLPWVSTQLWRTARSLLSPQFVPKYVELPSLIPIYGYLPVLLALVGTFVLALRGGKRNYGLVLGLLAILAMLATFFTLHYGQAFVYIRGIMPMLLLMSMVAGAGLMWLRNLNLPQGLTSYLKAPPAVSNVGLVLCLVVIALTLYWAIPARQNTPYYHMINTEDYHAFVWIREYVDESCQRAILNPWKGVPFTAITGRLAYARIYGTPSPNSGRARRFLSQGSTNTAFLRENGISIVYTRGKVNNPDLARVRDNVYLLQDREPE